MLTPGLAWIPFENTGDFEIVVIIIVHAVCIIRVL